MNKVSLNNINQNVIIKQECIDFLVPLYRILEFIKDTRLENKTKTKMIYL